MNRFPSLLHSLISEAENRNMGHVVSWTECGRLFKVHDARAFEKRMLPQFCRHKQFKSFQRQLSMYGFKRINEGPMRGAYFHRDFVRDIPSLCKYIRRRGSEMKVQSSGETEKGAFCRRDKFVRELQEYPLPGFSRQNTLVQPLLRPITLSMDELCCPPRDDRLAVTLEHNVQGHSLCVDLHDTITRSDILDEIISTFLGERAPTPSPSVSQGSD